MRRDCVGHLSNWFAGSASWRTVFLLEPVRKPLESSLVSTFERAISGSRTSFREMRSSRAHGRANCSKNVAFCIVEKENDASGRVPLSQFRDIDHWRIDQLYFVSHQWGHVTVKIKLRQDQDSHQRDCDQSNPECACYPWFLISKI